MFQIILNIFQKPEPEPKTYLESLIETVTLNFDKFINIFPINDINRTFCSSFSMGFVLTLCFFGVRAWISKPKKAKRVNLGPNAADFEDGILPVDFRASSKPFQVYPGLNVYYLHLSTQEELTYDDGARRTIAVQTVTSLQGDNIIIYEHMEEIIEGPIEQADSEIYSDEGMDISDGNSQDDSPTTSDGTTVIAKSSVLSKKPSRIPVIVPRPKTPTNATDLEN